MTWLIAKSFFGLPRWAFVAFAAALALIGLIGGTIWKVGAMMDDARAAGRAEVQAKWSAEKAGRAAASAELSAALAQAFNGLDGALQNTVRTIAWKGQDITVRVKKDLDNDPRYRSDACNLTDGVRREIDTARGLSGPARSAAVRDGGVPASGAAVRLELGDTGPR